MNRLFEKLDSEQRRIIKCEDKAVMVEGVVGSGKTDTLVAKILDLIYSKGVPGGKILVVAFNHGTVKEIQRRLRLYLPDGVTTEQRPKVYAFHEWFVRLLRYDLPIKKLGFTPNFSVCDAAENEFFFPRRNQAEESPGTLDKRQAILRELGMDSVERATLLRKMNTLFYDEQISFVNELCEQKTFDVPSWLIIDEFQNVEYSFWKKAILKCYQAESNILLFGDYSQKVYPIFRPGRPMDETFRINGEKQLAWIMKEFRPTCLTLSRNYRSTPAIVEAAKPFMLGNADMVAHRNDNGMKIVVKDAANQNTVANRFCPDIERVRQQGVAYSEMAVIVKDKNERRDVKAALDAERIPIYGNQDNDGEKRKALEWFIHLLLFSINPNDVYAKNEIPAFAPPLPQQSKDFKKWCDLVGDPDGIDEKLYRYFELDSQNIPSRADRSEQTDILKKFLGDLKESFRETGEKNVFYGIVDYLTACRLDQEKLLGVIEQGHDSIRLLTLHTSSGLEFKHVWMYGDFGPYKAYWEDNRPSYQYNEDEERLFFVGLTRASECVSIIPKLSDFPTEGRFLDRIPKSATIQETEQASVSSPFASYRGKQCYDDRYGYGSVIDENTEGLTIHYPNYRNGHTEFHQRDDIEYVAWES